MLAYLEVQRIPDLFATLLNSGHLLLQLSHTGLEWFGLSGLHEQFLWGKWWGTDLACLARPTIAELFVKLLLVNDRILYT